MTKWIEINEEAWCNEHLFRYEPDLVRGGAYLRDEQGRTWAIRTCAICGLRERREEFDMREVNGEVAS